MALEYGNSFDSWTRFFWESGEEEGAGSSLFSVTNYTPLLRLYFPLTVAHNCHGKIFFVTAKSFPTTLESCFPPSFFPVYPSQLPTPKTHINTPKISENDLPSPRTEKFPW